MDGTTIEGTLSGLRQFLAIERKPFKNYDYNMTQKLRCR